jgi:uncharacterized UBP type Zn finger protein
MSGRDDAGAAGGAGAYWQGCEHVSQIRKVTPSGIGCKECLEIGDTWVHFRICMICGHVGCCDDSKNRHATAHFHETGHPIMKSFETGEDWMWCFVDQVDL